VINIDKDGMAFSRTVSGGQGNCNGGMEGGGRGRQSGERRKILCHMIF